MLRTCHILSRSHSHSHYYYYFHFTERKAVQKGKINCSGLHCYLTMGANRILALICPKPSDIKRSGVSTRGGTHTSVHGPERPLIIKSIVYSDCGTLMAIRFPRTSRPKQALMENKEKDINDPKLLKQYRHGEMTSGMKETCLDRFQVYTRTQEGGGECEVRK